MAGISDLSSLLSRKRFSADLEATFQDEYFETSLRTHRIAILTAVVAYIIFEVLDLGMPADVLMRLTLIRLGVVLLLVALFTLSFAKFYRRLYDLCSSLGIIVTGVGVMAVQWVVDAKGFALYITSLLLIIISGYTLARLRPFVAALTGWSLWMIFVGIAILLNNLPIHIMISAVFLVVANVIGMLTAFFSDHYLRRDFIQRLMLEQERNRSESLLLNILPTPVAERLKLGELIADSFSDVSVLFADIVDFTTWSAGRAPEDVLAALNIIFSRFDDLAEKHGLEKIKTVGDAYMVVSGVPLPRKDHLHAMAEMALDMRCALSDLDENLAHKFEIRIGLNCGPVVAGVIGSKKFIYDLWGDTVNIASRLESHGLPGKTQVSETVYLRLRDQYRFEERGQITLKGRGDMVTYWLTGRL